MRRVRFSGKLLVAGTLLAVALAPQTSRASGAIELDRDVLYAEHGGVKLKADVYQPAGDGPYPGVLLVHGGAWRAGNKLLATALARRLAGAGYSVMAIDYRLAPEHKFPAQLEDCQAALAWMVANAGQYKIDVERIGGCGYSAGGHLVALMAASAAADDPQAGRLRAVVAGGAPCDFRVMPPRSDVLAYWLGGSRAQMPKAYETASPRVHVSADDPPMFFYHGQKDRLVPYIGAVAMVASLREAGVPAEFHLVPGAGHVEAYFDAAAVDKGIEFLDRHLKAPPGEQPAGDR